MVLGLTGERVRRREFIIASTLLARPESLHLSLALTNFAQESFVTWFRHAARNLLIGVIIAAVGGCVGPPVLERQVLGYDEVTKALDEKLLLLNIARVTNEETVHFTSTSSIAATFDWTTTLSVGGQVTEKGNNFFNLNIGGSAAENPTFSIAPIAGEEFTKRIATPFRDDIFEFLVFQGGKINQAMRLMASGIEVQKPDGRFLRFIENDPQRPEEYEEFRRVAAHLQWLNDNRWLFVRPLVFEETVIADFKNTPRAEDIINGFDKGLRWRQKANGNYELTRFRGGRVVATNYDPMALTDQQGFELDEKIKKNPSGFVYVDIRRDGPGGNFPIQGAIKLRSMFQILSFIAKGVHTALEFDVSPDPRTGETAAAPAATLKINITDRPPDKNVPTIYYEGRYYSLNDTVWDRTTFRLLSILFQTVVGKIENVGIPITISK